MVQRFILLEDLPVAPVGGGDEWITQFAGKIREIYKARLLELERRHRRGAGGIETACAVSHLVETIVSHIHLSLRSWMGPRLKREPAVVALGSFGRRELAPRSDVDLLFLWEKKPGSAGAAFAGYLVRMLWDSGLELRHSVRTSAELCDVIGSDSDLATSMLDARWFCGDEGLRDCIADLKAKIRGPAAGALLEAKLEEARRRWEKYSNSYHLVEPNVKESPGGLRDYQAIRWVGMALPWHGTLEGLYRLAIIDRYEKREVEKAFDFLLRVRCELHFLMRSDWNILTLAMQKHAANRLGYEAREGLLAVELFMRDYYSMTRSIYSVLDRILQETRGEGNLRLIDGVLYRRVGRRGLGQLDLRISKAHLKRDPLYPFKERLKTRKRFSPRTERQIRASFRSSKLDACITKRMRASFVELLEMPGRKADVVRSMHELGVLRHIFPPFEQLTCLKKYDLYHQYTADEHSLRALSALEEVADMGGGLLARIYGEVAEKTELALAALLHDIGKRSPRGHAVCGARIAEKLLHGFPLDRKARSLVCFLVREHLLLSQYSQRRDMQDRDTALKFLKKVRNHLNLKLLYLLTYADLKATGATVWTGWKENLLEDLYFQASRLLAERIESADSYARLLERKRARILDACSGEPERSRMQSHLDKLPERYGVVVSPAQARVHLDLIEMLRGRSVVLRASRRRSSIQLVICTRDKPFRLSQLCGAIAINDLSIMAALAFTRADGIVIDIFQCEPLDRNLPFTRKSAKKLEQDLSQVLSGQLDLEVAFAAHEERWKRRAAKVLAPSVSVEIENDLSRESTIIDISAPDRPGLLYRITRVISEEGLDIQSAQITTRGERAEDSFYVRTSEDGKLTDPGSMRTLRQKLRSALQPAV